MAIDIGVTYRDLGYQPKLTQTGDVNAVENMTSVKQAIMTIINTPKNTRLFVPDFGMDINRYVFEPLDGKAAADLREEVTNSINRYEPRVTVTNVTLSELTETTGYAIEITYRFKEFNATDSIIVNLQRL